MNSCCENYNFVDLNITAGFINFKPRQIKDYFRKMYELKETGKIKTKKFQYKYINYLL
jgi:hypothetical protein